MRIVATDFNAEIADVRHTLETISAVMDPDALRARIAELSEAASAPDLWDDQANAQAVTSALSHAQSELERLTRMDERIEDVETLVELGQEEDDAETLEEAERGLARLRRDLGDLEIRTLLNGDYDERDAVVTIRAGAGGVDAADFAEMLLRMYLRWAERNNFSAKVMDTSYAE